MKPSSREMLEIALAAKPPIPAGHVEELAATRRRITVRDHERWRETHQPPHKDDADIEELLHELRDPLEIAIKPERLHPRKT